MQQSPETRDKVKALALAGVPVREIAEAVGVSKTRVYQLLNSLKIDIKNIRNSDSRLLVGSADRPVGSQVGGEVHQGASRSEGERTGEGREEPVSASTRSLETLQQSVPDLRSSPDRVRRLHRSHQVLASRVRSLVRKLADPGADYAGRSSPASAAAALALAVQRVVQVERELAGISSEASQDDPRAPIVIVPVSVTGDALASLLEASRAGHKLKVAPAAPVAPVREPAPGRPLPFAPVGDSLDAAGFAGEEEKERASGVANDEEAENPDAENDEGR